MESSESEWRDGTDKVRPLERRGKSAERSEKRETSTIKMRGSKEAMVRCQNGGMAPAPKREEGRASSESIDRVGERLLGRVVVVMLLRVVA